jgi:hypothetical protein
MKQPMTFTFLGGLHSQGTASATADRNVTKVLDKSIGQAGCATVHLTCLQVRASSGCAIGNTYLPALCSSMGTWKGGQGSMGAEGDKQSAWEYETEAELDSY